MSKGEQLRLACNDRLDEAQRLIEEGVDVDSRSEFGLTPLMIAADKGRVDIIRLLLDNGANIQSQSIGWTALNRAAYNGHDEAVRLLIKRGANLHVRGYHSKTPLDKAKQNNHSSTAAIIKTAIKSTKGKNE